MHCALLKPKSKGTITLRSSDPNDPPICEFQYLSRPDDWSALRTSLRVTTAIARSIRDDGYPLEDLIVPDTSSDAALDKFIHERMDTMTHYTSSCRMAAADDPDGPGVVDASLRVYGVQNLRIADASIFPISPATHPQALVYAIAEKCADMILSDAAKEASA